jgi:glucosylceramidase
MIRVTQTARDVPHRLTELSALAFGRKTDLRHSVMVDPAVKYQEIEGFGGAFTEAAADTLRRMPASPGRVFSVGQPPPDQRAADKSAG